MLRSGAHAWGFLIVTPLVREHDYAHRMCPSSSNTLPLLTLRDPTSGEPFVAAALQRFGTSESGWVDNWGAVRLSTSPQVCSALRSGSRRLGKVCTGTIPIRTRVRRSPV